MKVPGEIRIEDVLEAYEKTGFRPTQHEYYFSYSDGTRCACPVAAIVEQHFPGTIDFNKHPDIIVNRILEMATNGLLMDPEYVNGFIAGFDEASSIKEVITNADRLRPEFIRGWFDGHWALKEIEERNLW